MGKVLTLVDLDELFKPEEGERVKDPIWKVDKIQEYKKAIGIASQLYDDFEYDKIKEPRNAHFIIVNTTPMGMCFDTEEKQQLYKKLLKLTDFMDFSSSHNGKRVELMFGFYLIENRNFD